MQGSRRWALGITVVSAGALAWALFGAALPPDAQHVAERVNPQGSPVYTPAHRSALDAIRDFLNRRPAPVQPIAYTHKAHLAVGMQCINCHVAVEQSPVASIPGVAFCMTCHQAIATDRPEIKKLAAYLERGEDIPWQRVYDYPPSAHVKFNHAVHIRANVACATCHGDMTQRTVAVRVVNMTMRFCIDCHRQRQASLECLTCHF